MAPAHVASGAGWRPHQRCLVVRKCHHTNPTPRMRWLARGGPSWLHRWLPPPSFATTPLGFSTIARITSPLIRFLRCRRAAPIYERLQLRMAWAAGLWLIPGRRGAVGGEGVGHGLFDRCGVHTEDVGDLAAVDDEGFLELVLHLR